MKPSEEGALALHRKHGSSEAIVSHCLTVAKVSVSLAEGCASRGRLVDVEAVELGALLHDIGRSRVQTALHGVEGALIVEHEGLDRAVAEIVRRHVGAGIDDREAKALGFPEGDYIPRSLEERIVCFADKMVDGTKVRGFDQEVERFRKKNHDVQRLLALKEGIEEQLGEDPEAFIFGKIKESH